MPKTKYNELTDLKIKKAAPKEKPYKLLDGAGLHLEVRPQGSKNWRYRFRLQGKESVYAIGSYPEISLSEARKQRDKAKELVKQGINPAHYRQKLVQVNIDNAQNDFQAIAEKWIEQSKGNWSPYYLSQVTRGLQANVYPRIGKLPIRSIDSGHILQVLEVIDARGAKTIAQLVRQWLSAIFQFAIIRRLAVTDPALPLKGYIKKEKVKHHRPLSEKEIAEFKVALDKFGGFIRTKIALQLLLFTFVRPGELRGASWNEFDLEAREWRIPAERMKMRDPHIVPLSKQVIRLLKDLQTSGTVQGNLFPNLRSPSKVMTSTTLNRALERMGFNGKGTIGFSSHGFRATASTMLHEQGFRTELIEKQLAHSDRNKVRAAYNQGQYLKERQAMMQKWADYIDSIT
jgi:integrase